MSDWCEVYEEAEAADRGFPFKARFFLTFGGGPEGGYLVFDDGRVAECERTTGEPWTIKLRPGFKLETRAGPLRECRLTVAWARLQNDRNRRLVRP